MNEGKEENVVESGLESLPKIRQVIKPHAHDVLSGRGGLSNNHVGNLYYRKLVEMSKNLYNLCPKNQKIIVARSIVAAIQNQQPPGRFLQKENEGNDTLWHEIKNKKATEKTSQALREGKRFASNFFSSSFLSPSSSSFYTSTTDISSKKRNELISESEEGKKKLTKIPYEFELKNWEDDEMMDSIKELLLEEEHPSLENCCKR